MYFKSIEVENFRNYENQRVDFNEHVNIITGQNAQGKTNLIEGLYIMSMGKSFRTFKDNELIRFGQDIARVKTVSFKDGEDLTVELGFAKNRKSIKIDGVKKRKTSELLENVYVVIFAPDDLRIVKDEPEKRRRFMDMELCQLKPVYYRSLGRYKKALLQRNFLLKETHPDMAMLDVWDSELAEYGSRIIHDRAMFTEKIHGISREIHRDLTDNREILSIFYEADIDPRGTREEIKESFIEILRKSRSNDLAKRRTNKGPHRDDLRIEIDGIDVRNFGSQGQQRTAALSLKLAEIKMIQEETGEKPVLLLDDVLSELDRVRQKQLITSFDDIQIFITTTEITDDLNNELPDHYIFQVEKGKVERK